MRVLFVMRHSGYVRNFESTLRMLCDRGHTVHLAFQIGATHALLDSGDMAQALADEYPLFSRGGIPAREDSWGHVATDLRTKLDYLRYLEPEYAAASKLRARAVRDVPNNFVQRTTSGPFSTRTGRAVIAAWLRALDRAIPTDPRLDAFLLAHRPDLLVVTPLIEPGSPQTEYLRSARAHGIRAALCVASWDNLTNKGVVHGEVQLVAVWNETMKAEAVQLHGIPAERIAVTGAQPFDHWFTWQPRTTRNEFCAYVGLPGGVPYLLYVCSSRFVAPEEVPFVREWLRRLRQSTPALREAGVLVRPHPQNAQQWHGVDLSDCGPVVVWPAAGAAPADDRSRADYFDSIFHSAGVVGVNTTAEIESAIVGRSVFTVLAPEFRETQEGTPHFKHLRRVNGGLLHVARDFPEHVQQLDAALRNDTNSDDRCRRFVEAFVRPHGVEVASTPKLVDALEELVQRAAPQPGTGPVWAPVVRPFLSRRGRRLQLDALLEVEAKTVRKATKKRKKPDGEQPTVTAHMKKHGTAQLSWRDLVAGFDRLEQRDRVRFLRATLPTTPGELLMENAQPERLDYPEAEIYLRVTSKAERHRLRACAKEPFTIEWIRQSVSPGDVFYDIGANVGAYSLVAAKKPGGGARVFAFEPSYANVASLCANIVLNDAADQITPLPYALSDSDRLTVFNLRGLDPGSALHALGDGSPEKGRTRYRQPVMTFRLDELVGRFGLPLPNHVKLDVDGGELAVLEGAAQTLASGALRSMLVEVSTSLSDTVTTVLAAHGLTLEAKVNVKNTAGEYLVWYGLFTRRPKDAAIDRQVRVEFVSR